MVEKGGEWSPTLRIQKKMKISSTIYGTSYKAKESSCGGSFHLSADRKNGKRRPKPPFTLTFVALGVALASHTVYSSGVGLREALSSSVGKTATRHEVTTHDVSSKDEDSKDTIWFENDSLKRLGLRVKWSPVRVYFHGQWHVVHAYTKVPVLIRPDKSARALNFTLVDEQQTYWYGRSTTSENKKVVLQLSIKEQKQGGDRDEITVFEQHFFGGDLLGTAYRNASEFLDDSHPEPQTSFPVFFASDEGKRHPEQSQVSLPGEQRPGLASSSSLEETQTAAPEPWNYFLIAGCQLAEVHTGTNTLFPQPSHLGYESSPLVWHRNGSTAVLSHLSHFKHGVMSRGLNKDTHDGNDPEHERQLRLGLSGELERISKDTRYAAVLYHSWTRREDEDDANKAGEGSGGVVDVPRHHRHNSQVGVRQTMYRWGNFVHDFVRAEKNGGKKKHLPDDSDPVLAKLGFFTDNGAQFYGDSYNAGAPRGQGRELNLTCCTSDKIYPVLRKGGTKPSASPGVPSLHYLQLDDWWYRGVYPSPQDWGIKCVEDWTFPTSVGADRNFSDIARQFPDLSLMLYGPFFCPNSTLLNYSHTSTSHSSEQTQTTATASWVSSGTMPVLTPRGTDGSSEKIYDELFRRAAFAFGDDPATLEQVSSETTATRTQLFTNFEIDFMNEIFLRSADFRSTLDLYESWLWGLDKAARKANLYVQYCMMLPSDVFLAIAMDRTTNGRASDDYAAVHTWDVFASSLLFDSLRSMRPSKDNFWSSPVYPSDANFNVLNTGGGDPSMNLLVHSLVATYSLGPVGVSDLVLNGTVLSRIAMSNGTLLRPQRPLTVADKVWQEGYHSTGRVASTRIDNESFAVFFGNYTRTKDLQGGEKSAFWNAEVVMAQVVDDGLGGGSQDEDTTSASRSTVTARNNGVLLVRRIATMSDGTEVPWESDPAMLAEASGRVDHKLVGEQKIGTSKQAVRLRVKPEDRSFVKARLLLERPGSLGGKDTFKVFRPSSSSLKTHTSTVSSSISTTTSTSRSIRNTTPDVTLTSSSSPHQSNNKLFVSYELFWMFHLPPPSRRTSVENKSNSTGPETDQLVFLGEWMKYVPRSAQRFVEIRRSSSSTTFSRSTTRDVEESGRSASSTSTTFVARFAPRELTSFSWVRLSSNDKTAFRMLELQNNHDEARQMKVTIAISEDATTEVEMEGDEIVDVELLSTWGYDGDAGAQGSTILEGDDAAIFE
ncbi:unnamed protein product [Amoebophrya sp. A25]|nr:unnamed protein product [Amoebophrya sp. A25]|eukprot:GSA25T00002830001.1